MNFYIETYGCQMNERDSEEIASRLKIEGFFEVSTPEDADIVFVNTCSVREKPSQKALSATGRYIKSKNNRKRIVALCGCFAKQEGENIRERFPNIDLVFGPQQIKDVVVLLKKVIEERQSIIDVSDSGYISEEQVPEREEGVTAFVNITRGCNNFCSFCIVPYLRGREFSRESEIILREIKGRVENGVREITLLGQNVNSYLDEKRGVDFVRLLELIHNIDGVERIRFTTSHPKDVSDRLIEAFRTLPKLCSHIHLPVQSGSDRILKLMNRKYDRRHYLNIIDRLRKVRDDIAITTDIIVGFPTESERDFEDTLSLLEYVQYDTAFSFKYSPRPLTKAYKELPDDVPEEVKEERLKILQDMIEAIAQKRNRLLIDKVLEVLIEGNSRRFKTQFTGRSSCNRVVNIKSEVDIRGKIVKVRVVDALKHSLIGEILEGVKDETGGCSRNIA
ncbi:MAG: tRNA (N6-isopentenyl adenosine(37)-C2)-methylthiotransferase MiaB [Myxococcota bacterium]